MLRLMGVRERTLKDLSVELPLGQLVLVTGVSGAGKTSLVVETIFAESQRRYLETFSPSIRQRLSGMKSPRLDEAVGLVNCVLINAESARFPKRKPVFEILDADESLRELLVRGSQVACPMCGEQLLTWKADEAVDDLLKVAAGQRAIIGFPDSAGVVQDAQRVLEVDAGRRVGIVDRVKLEGMHRERLLESLELAMMEGEGRWVVLVEDASGQGAIEYQGRRFTQRLYSRLPYCERDDRWVVMPDWNWDMKAGEGDADAFRYAGLTFAEFLKLTCGELYALLLEGNVETDVVVRNARARLKRVCRVLVEMGLSHVVIGQRFGELSSGERTRLLLANVMLLATVESMLIIDELSSGLSDEMLSEVVAALKALIGAGNTVVVVDHHRELEAAADWVIQMGPGAGAEGGRVMYSGPAKTWSGRDAPLSLPKQEGPRQRSWVKLDDGAVGAFDLRDVKIQTGGINVIAGARGKTRLLTEVLLPWGSAGAFDEVVLVDQERVGGSRRSTPASIMKISPEVRELFAQTLEAKLRNWNPRYFSLHVEGGGRCPRCKGVGEVDIDLKHLALVSTVCPECDGSRYLPEVLGARYRGLSIAEVFRQSVDEAFVFFRSQLSIQKKLQVMRELGLGYLTLGQPARTISAGELQRLKIATSIVSVSARRKLFLLDEPTAGLHASEIERLWTTLGELTAGGNTVVVAEHDRAVIEAAGHVIEVEAQGDRFAVRSR